MSETPSYLSIVHKLKKKTIYWKEILELLNENTVLSGGFVLQTILGENWALDIDIFTTDSKLLDNLKEKIPNSQIEKKTNDPYKFSGILSGYKITADCTIDVLYVKDIKKFIESFDFDFCKCYFDGNQIYIDQPKSVLNKECLVHPDYLDDKEKIPRILKYLKRGFKISTWGCC